MNASAYYSCITQLVHFLNIDNVRFHFIQYLSYLFVNDIPIKIPYFYWTMWTHRASESDVSSSISSFLIPSLESQTACVCACLDTLKWLIKIFRSEWTEKKLPKLIKLDPFDMSSFIETVTKVHIRLLKLNWIIKVKR